MNNMRGPSNFGPPPVGPGPMFRGGFRGPPPGGFMGPDNGPPGSRGMRGPPPFQGQFDNGFHPPLNQGPGMIGPDMHGNHPPMGPRGGFMRPHGNMLGPIGPSGPMHDAMRPPPPIHPNIDHNKELWVETLSDQGKIYFYNAKTRQSVWKKPTDENVQIIKQNEVQNLANATFPPFAGNIEQQQSGLNNLQDNNNEDSKNIEEDSLPQSETTNQLEEDTGGVGQDEKIYNEESNEFEDENDQNAANKEPMQNPP
uniref:WW domain-containing protein n=1 Tax=Ciona savignyi TaxID=51511 RepID=H2ZB82_CIOSA